jgi:hypothetical protein
MKIVISESQLKTIISESPLQVKSIKNINWWGLVKGGQDEWKRELQNTVSASNEYYTYITQLMQSFTTDMKDGFEQDVINGQLSKSTIDKFNNNIISTLSNLSKDSQLNTDLQNIPYSQRKLAKTVGRGKIKEGINKTFLLTGQKFFKEGFVLNLKKYYTNNSPIVQNYIKVSNQMGDFVIGNQQLQNHILNFILSKL